MNWVKVHNSLRDNPKILEVSDGAFRLYVCSLCYANEHLTDGFIARRALDGVTSGLRSPLKKARELVTIGLWEEHEEGRGWQIHDYTEVQRSARQVKETRRRDRERKMPDPDAEQHQGTNGIQADSSRNPRAEKRREEKKELITTSSSNGSTVRELFAYWQQQCQHPQSRLTSERRRKCEARLREGYTAEQGRTAIDGAARAAFVNDQGKRFDDFELIFRSGSKLEAFIERARLNGAGPARRSTETAALAAAHRGDPA